MNDNKLIIDNDAGGDDALAIFIALLYEKYFQGPQLIALTTANGNTNEDNVFINNQKILNVAKRRDVPIYRGCKESLVITPQSSQYYGEDGLGNNGEVLTDPLPVQNEGAVLTLINLSKKYPGNITVVTIGTLTNIALAIKLDPEFLGRLNHLYIGGGHIYSEKYPSAEFNVRMDAEAYHIVVEHATPDKVTIVPFSQIKEHLTIDMDWRRDTLGGLDTDIIRAQNIYEDVALKKKMDKWDSLDPATVSVALSNMSTGPGKPDFVTEYKYSKSGIILCGDKRGINTNTFVRKEDANVRIAYSFDMEMYKSFLFHLFSADVSRPK
ncbi:probable uridine nucleosidase 2 [Hyposmocoma kahamanoa]|uniref:probable uridine nucleosidase 2 n=1 Tax=Hyposmocoma kahamanoa TaxID=1477025 RepID=UPI000E6D6F3B|nr:probable uridine nucleosidase 2 [Hyposmocoma kahamanoa]